MSVKNERKGVKLNDLQQGYIQQLLNVANQSRQESDLTTAIACYQKILRLQPDDTDLYLELGNVFHQQQQTEQAIAAYRQAFTINPEQPAWVYHCLGKALQEQQQEQEAIAAYEQGVKLDTQAPVWVYRNLADLLAKQEQYDQAIAIYQQLIQLAPANTSTIQTKIGDIYHQQKKIFAAKASYQQASRSRALHHIDEVITFIRQHFIVDANLLKIDILDNGCDPTGSQLAILAEQTQGQVVGTNIYQGFPEQTVKRRRANNQFYWMDGQNLTFDDCSFDLVISLNTLEHVSNPAKYLQECYRVLRPGGFGYFSWYPLWSGATGHHIHPDMVSRMAQKLGLASPGYSLDGNSIPFWGHLLLSPEEMRSFLLEEKKYDSALVQWMINYIYYSNDLNRWFWRDVRRSFKNLAWDFVEENHRANQSVPPEILHQLIQKYGIRDDFQISGARIIVRKFYW